MPYNNKNKNIQETKTKQILIENKKQQQQHVNQYLQLAKFVESLIDTKKTKHHKNISL